MSGNDLTKRRGAVLDFGACLVGRNLNLLAVRGFANLDELADISAPDVYDMIDNQAGTQRALKPKHANESFEYAMEAMNEPPESSPRCFPEVILNARDDMIIELYEIQDPDNHLSITSFTDIAEVESKVVGLRIRVADLDYPKSTKSPQISRVDGNHRLSKADEVMCDPDLDPSDPDSYPDFPLVPFSMLLGLSQNQEARLFRDINGQHEGMETAHLDSMLVRISNPEELKQDSGTRPLWLAHSLAQGGHSWEGKVFFGGSQAGVKKAQGALPPIKINALKSAIAIQLRSAPQTSVAFFDKPDQLFILLDRYWRAVREVFPEAWQDKKDYILLQSIGLNAFAKFGGIALDRALELGKADVEDFKHVLVAIKEKVSLQREDHPGIAGAGGANRIADLMIAASDGGSVEASKVFASLAADLPKGGVSLDEPHKKA